MKVISRPDDIPLRLRESHNSGPQILERYGSTALPVIDVLDLGQPIWLIAIATSAYLSLAGDFYLVPSRMEQHLIYCARGRTRHLHHEALAAYPSSYR